MRDVRSPALGYAMVAIAATLFAINGTVSKVILASGITAEQLTEVRCAGALAGLALIAAVTRPRSLRIGKRELPLLLALGIVGLALVQWSYFFAIHRIEIGVALVIQFVGPILVALWARFVYGEDVRSRIWIALAFALTGLALMVELWNADSPSGAGLAAAGLAAVTYAAYILLAERAVRRRDPISLSAWGFLFATIFWSVLAPWWDFPGAHVDDSTSLLGNLASSQLPIWALIAWMVVLGTIVHLRSCRRRPAPHQRHQGRNHRDVGAGPGHRGGLGLAGRASDPSAASRSRRYSRGHLARPDLPLTPLGAKSTLPFWGRRPPFPTPNWW